MLVEGIKYRLKWRALKLGESFFIPCLDQDSATQRVSKEASERGLTMFVKAVIEHGVKGIRAWRI